MPKVFIGVGSNLEDRAGHLESARKKLLLVPGVKEFKASSVYETQPVDAGGGLFLNAVWSFETELPAPDLLLKLQEIESAANRERKKKNDARTLDLDILFYGEATIQSSALTVPHPRLHERAFVLVPFCDLAPEWVHPVLKKTVSELFNELENPYGVRRIL
jgi:2-amino-4-hydroxy-6-hydroxymethyldihydropteridine diphosphokinase